MEVVKIYFDMDDTIADFSRGLVEICGMEPVYQDMLTTEQDEAMWNAIKDAGDFYYRLKECEPGMELLRQLREKYGDKVEILTAIPKEKRGIVSAASDKRRWVEEHIGTDIKVNIALSAADKKLMSGPGRFLVDDLIKNINAWRAAGGVGILFSKDDPKSTGQELNKSRLL